VIWKRRVTIGEHIVLSDVEGVKLYSDRHCDSCRGKMSEGV